MNADILSVLKELLVALWDIIGWLALALAQRFIDATGLFEGKPEYVIGLAIIFVAVALKLR